MIDRAVRGALERIRVRLSNILARGVVQLAADGGKLQVLQLGVLAGEPVDDCERYQEFGFSSVPLKGAEAVVLFLDGDRSRPMVVAVDDRRYRPTGGEPGEVVVYNHTGATIRITVDGDVEVTPANGRKVRLGSSGASDPVALKSDLDALKTWLDAHTHPVATTGTATAQTGTAAPSTAPSPAPSSSGKVDAE